jgi:radical SAM protein with 4Fe4S-binding SPASM domain
VNDGLLTIDGYAKLLEDLIGKTNLIEISGIGTDPITYPYFCQLVSLIKERNFNFGIHTKGFKLTKELCKLLNSGNTEGNYITISLDSGFRELYNVLHGSPKYSKIFDHIVKQMGILKKEKEQNNSKLRINISYLLFKDNSNVEHIQKFIEIFEPLTDVLRFSIPQVPNKAKPIGYLSPDEIDAVLDILKNFEKENIIVLNFGNSEHDTNFKRCWAQRFNLTIDKAGNVFPCPQVALSDYNHLRYGNLRDKTIWEIWNSKKRKEILGMYVDDMKCLVCDRKDENINIELDKILDQDKYI